jgi:tetratricopeptide (TPR) repeat protein
MVEIATYSDEWKICCWMGTAMLNLGDITEAVSLFADALAMTPDRAFVCRQAGNSLLAAGHKDLARFYMEESHRLTATAPKQYSHADAKGSVPLPVGEQVVAPLIASGGLRISANHSETYFLKGLALEKAGKLREAEISYMETIRRNNSHVGAYNNLTGILLRRNEDQEALKVLQTASDTALNHAALRYTLGLVHSVIGNQTEALEHFDKTLELTPGLKKANIQKAIIFLKMNDFDHAVECLNKEVANGGDVIPALITLGEINLHLGNRQQALHHFHEVIALDPDNATAKKHIESIQKQQQV